MNDNNVHIGKVVNPSLLHLSCGKIEIKNKAYGQLVLLGFDVTTFIPAAYQRRSLRQPLKVNSS